MRRASLVVALAFLGCVRPAPEEPEAAPPPPLPVRPEGGYTRAQVPQLIDFAKWSSSQKKHGEAIKYAEEARAADPFNPEVYQAAGSVYGAAGDFNKMCAAYQEYLKLEPGAKRAPLLQTQMAQFDPLTYPSCKVTSF
jgi:tetratricopeptide (TPR) repeat protein